MPHKALRAIRRFCFACQGGHAPSVAACKDVECTFFVYRRASLDPETAPKEAGETGEKGEGNTACEARCEHVGQQEQAYAIPPLRAVRRYCLECAGSRSEVRECDAKESCAVWSYRFGVLPTTFKRVVARRNKKRVELTLPGISLR